MSIGRDEPFTQSLLLAAYQGTAARLLAELHRAGHPAIRHKHGAVFANLDREGTRPSVLAERAGMSKPAMGELVDELVGLGYVRREPDPTDGRARIVLPTESALDVIRVVTRVNRGIERRYRRVLGDAGYEALREALRAVVPPERALVQPRPTTRDPRTATSRRDGSPATTSDGPRARIGAE